MTRRSNLNSREWMEFPNPSPPKELLRQSYACNSVASQQDSGDLRDPRPKEAPSRTFCSKTSLEQARFQWKELNQASCRSKLLLPMSPRPRPTILFLFLTPEVFTRKNKNWLPKIFRLCPRWTETILLKCRRDLGGLWGRWGLTPRVLGV